jgi:Pyruvate/2-oxoacid:ferredoxin oxidoreductase delta subunit
MKETDLEQKLESMADQGQILVATTDRGEREYSLVPIVPGLVEFQAMKDNAEAMRLAQKMREAVNRLAEPLFRDPELANKKLGGPVLRTLAVEEQIPSETAIADWERIGKIMETEVSFAVGTCACRYSEELEGNPCRIEDVAMEACVYFGKVADYMVDRGFARRHSREELLELLRTCEEQGLIHNINNFTGDNLVLCNCCGCCCHILEPMLAHRGIVTIANSNFKSVVEPESCTGCGDCEEICQLKAISITDDTAEVNQSYCIGCGNCVSICPAECLSLTRCASEEPPQKPKFLVGLGV